MVTETLTAGGPKITVVGKIDLTRFEKKTAVKPVEEKPKLKYQQYGPFPIDIYKKVAALAAQASKKIGTDDVITVSKTAKIKVNKPDGKFAFEEVANKGSIWYACSYNELKKNFLDPLHVLEVTNKLGIRRLTKGEFLNMSFGLEFTFVYVNKKGKVDTMNNIRVDGGDHEKEGLCYRGLNQATVYCLNFSDIKEDGTFNTGVDGETGYFYIAES